MPSIIYINDGNTQLFSVNYFGNQRIIYPKEAKEKNIEGICIVKFDLDSNFKMNNLSIKKYLGYGLDEVAMDMTLSLQPAFDKINQTINQPLNGLEIPIMFKTDNQHE